MKNSHSILKVHPLFNQTRQGCSEHPKETHGLMFLALRPLGEQARGLVTGAEQPWKVARLRRVLIPGLEAEVRQASIREIFKTITGLSGQQGACDGAPRLNHHDAT